MTRPIDRPWVGLTFGTLVFAVVYWIGGWELAYKLTPIALVVFACGVLRWALARYLIKKRSRRF